MDVGVEAFLVDGVLPDALLGEEDEEVFGEVGGDTHLIQGDDKLPAEGIGHVSQLSARLVLADVDEDGVGVEGVLGDHHLLGDRHDAVVVIRAPLEVPTAGHQNGGKGKAGRDAVGAIPRSRRRQG